MSTRDRSVLRVSNETVPSDEHRSDHGHRLVDGLSLTELSPTEWRVTDTQRDEGDPSAVLGFIQNVGGAFEVTNLARLRERSYFATFDRAAASLVPERRTPTALIFPPEVRA